MAKRRTEVTKVPDQPAVQAEHYQIGVWAGIPQYRCTLCPFDTLEKLSMLEHLFVAHALQVEGYTPAPVQQADQLQGQVPDEGVFEVELKEIGQTVDEAGNVHTQYTIKE